MRSLLFKFKPKQSLGIDLGTDSIKIAQLATTRHGLELKSWQILPVCRHNVRSWSNALSTLKSQLHKQITALAIPERILISKSTPITLPITRAGLKLQLQNVLQAITATPHELSFDYYITADDAPKLTVAAAHKQEIHRRQQAVSEFGAKVASIETSTTALMRVLAKLYPHYFNARYCLLDLGKQYWQCTLATQGCVEFYRYELLSDLSPEALVPAVQRFWQRNREYYAHQAPFHEIDYVLLCGGYACALAPDVQLIEANATIIINPLSRLSPTLTAKAARLGPQLMQCIGLALRQAQC